MNSLIEIFIALVCAALVMIIHEYPKVIVANTLTHPVYRKKRDNIVNPLKFIDPIGVIMFIFAFCGWQKPADYNPNRLKNKEKGLLFIALTGLLSNVFVMTLAFPVYIVSTTYLMQRSLFIFIYFNFAITIINLLPIPPLDMSKIVYAFSPNNYFKLIQNEGIVHAVFILMLVLSIIPEMIRALFVPFLQALLRI